MKWFFESSAHRFIRRYWILPVLSLVYDKDYFLETGVTTKAWIFEFKWLDFGFYFKLQQGY